ncbi:MAG: DUF488 family protein [Thermoplasmatales archaeon]
MVIKTKSIYEPIEPDDGVRVLITRYYPRGVKKDNFDIWLRSLSPSPELLKRYKNGMESWGDFELHFANEINNNSESNKGLENILMLAKESNVTLLCYEKRDHNCHRYLVMEMLKDQVSTVGPFYA